jgi:hypothetical protein
VGVHHKLGVVADADPNPATGRAPGGGPGCSGRRQGRDRGRPGLAGAAEDAMAGDREDADQGEHQAAATIRRWRT